MKKIKRSDLKEFKKEEEKRGRKPKSEKLYEELRNMRIGELFFISRKEWKATGYKTKSFKCWISITQNQTREKHKGQLSNYKFKVTTFDEGWSIEKIK